jgi:NADH dehydrogenase
MRLVVVGGGFGGLQVVRNLKRARVDITLIDRRNFHLFQPLAYQVATGSLSPEEIAAPLRHVFKRQRNVRVLLAEVVGFELEQKVVHAANLPSGEEDAAIPYDTLVVAGGSRYSYFGHDEWQADAPELKSLEGALDIRTRILTAFEAAEVERDEEKRSSWLTFVVVGAGPTGVEMAGQIAELAHDTRNDFRSMDPRSGDVLLVEVADRVLTAFPPSLSKKAAAALQKLGVTTLVGHMVIDVGHDRVLIQTPNGEQRNVSARTVVWAAGVTASALAAELANTAGAELDRSGRVIVGPRLTLPGHPDVFAIGDMVQIRDPSGAIVPLPGLAPVAMQQGRYVARLIRKGLRVEDAQPFRYVDKGNLATIGRSKAVAEIKGFRLSGFPAWATWLLVHLFYLIGFENRLLVLVRWTFSFLTHGRGARLISSR